MSHEISRMYATAADAENAAAELRDEGFSDVFVVSPPARPDVPVSAIAAQIAHGRVLLSDARIYAEGVARGGSLVTVHAPFGSGMLASNILDSYPTIPNGMPEPERVTMWDEAAPLSSAMHMPILIDDAAPASRVIGLAPLTGSGCGLSSMIGMPLLSDGGPMGDSKWGLPLLSSNPAPLSSLLGLKLLRQDRRKGA
jgi:hypothetical protein